MKNTETERRGLKILLCLLAITGTLLVQAAEDLPTVALQPLGEVPGPMIAAAKQGIETRFRVRVEVLPSSPLPQIAYYAPRDRYRADKLLDWLVERQAGEPIRFLKIIGLTTRDISTTKGEVYDWGIFGLGTLGGRSCVVSSWRLKPKPGQGATLLDRTVKVVNHELGHTFGLEHCPRVGCLMQDAGGSVLTVDREDGSFCESCAARLGANLR